MLAYETEISAFSNMASSTCKELTVNFGCYLLRYVRDLIQHLSAVWAFLNYSFEDRAS